MKEKVLRCTGHCKKTSKHVNVWWTLHCDSGHCRQRISDNCTGDCSVLCLLGCVVFHFPVQWNSQDSMVKMVYFHLDDPGLVTLSTDMSRWHKKGIWLVAVIAWILHKNSYFSEAYPSCWIGEWTALKVHHASAVQHVIIGMVKLDFFDITFCLGNFDVSSFTFHVEIFNFIWKLLFLSIFILCFAVVPVNGMEH